MTNSNQKSPRTYVENVLMMMLFKKGHMCNGGLKACCCYTLEQKSVDHFVIFGKNC